MRRFKLINAIGEEFDLMYKAAFFHRPAGLGFSRTIESITTDYDWIETHEELGQQKIDGEMVFRGYGQYSRFIEFCARSPLVICYSPSGKEWYRQCKLESVEKGEIGSESFRLVCAVTFLCLSKWYDNTIVSRSQSEAGQGKIYSYGYPFIYSEVSAGTIEINNTGSQDALCKLHIMGVAVNPSWALSSQGVIVLRGAVTCNISEGNKLVVDSAPRTMEIAEYTVDNHFIQNLYGKSDFSTARFIIAPPGRSVLTVAHEGSGDIDAWLEVRMFAATV